HAGVLALDVDDDDRPPGPGDLLDHHLAGVRLARADSPEHAEVARQDGLVLAAQAERDVLVAGQPAEDEVAVAADEGGDVLVLKRHKGGPGGRARAGVAEAAGDELALDLDPRQRLARGVARG